MKSIVKKRVLYADPICYDAHKPYNYNNIKTFSNICSLSLFVADGYVTENQFDTDEVFFYKKSRCWDNIQHKSKLSYFVKTSIAFLSNFKEMLRILKKKHFDMLFISCVNLPMLSLATMFSKKKNIAFIDHGIYLAVDRKYFRFFWKHLNRRLNVCILESYFSNFLKEDLKIKNKLYLLHHPLGEPFKSNQSTRCANQMVVFAPSASNSIQFESELINKHNLIPNGFKIIYKGKSDFCTEKLVVYNKKLTRTEYENTFACSNMVMIPYDNNYNFRTSGVLFEAIANKKPILLKNGNTLKYYSTEYSNIFDTFDTFDDLLMCLQKHLNQKSVNDEFFLKVTSTYNATHLAEEFEILLNGVCE